MTKCNFDPLGLCNTINGYSTYNNGIGLAVARITFVNDEYIEITRDVCPHCLEIASEQHHIMCMNYINGHNAQTIHKIKQRSRFKI